MQNPLTANKGGRPKKNPEDLFSHHINLRLTQAEYAQVLAEAERAQAKLSVHLHDRIVNHQLTFHQKVVPDEKYRTELKRVGNSLNQIATVLNSTSFEGSVLQALWDLTAIRAELVKFTNPEK